MLVYIGLIVYHIALMIGSKFLPKKKSFKILTIILFVLPIILLASLKSVSVGNDTQSYLNYYNLSKDQLSGNGMPSEKGFVLLMRLFRTLNIPFFGFLLFTYLIVYFGCALFAYKKSQNPLLVLFFICYFGLLGFSMSGIRQSIAIGIMLIGASFFYYKKPISILGPIVATVIAFFFHRTVLVVLPVYFILLFDFKRNTAIYIFLVFLILGLSAPFIYSYVIVSMGSLYYPSKENTFFTLIIYFLFALILVILTLKKLPQFENKIFKKCKDNRLINLLEPNTTLATTDDVMSYRTLTAYIVFPILISIFGMYAAPFARIAYYTIAFTGLLLVNEFNKSTLRKETRVLLNSLLVVFLVGYFTYSVLIKNPINVAHYSFGPIMF